MTASSEETSTTMQWTKPEETKPGTNASQGGEVTGRPTLGGQRKQKNKKDKDIKTAGQAIADSAATADDLNTIQTNFKDIPGDDAKITRPESIESVGSGPKPTAYPETTVEVSMKKDEKMGHRRSVTVEDVPQSSAILAEEDIPYYKSTAGHEQSDPVATEIFTSAAASSARANVTLIQPAVSPSTASSESVVITPTSPPATEPHFDFSAAAIFPHAFQPEEPPKHIIPEPMTSPIPNPIHPHNPTRFMTEDLVRTVTSHHHLPHHQRPHPQPNRLQTESILLRDAPIPPPPKPRTPAPPIHAPGPGVTAGRIVMLADPPPPIGCLAPTRERQLTEYNIGHLHAGHAHTGHMDNPYISSTEPHPTGYTQNPHAAELPGTSIRGPYDSGRDKRNHENVDIEGEGGGLFGRRTPTGATVSTNGYYRRGEDVGLVASLVSLWEKSVGWFQEWMDTTRR